jgi:hypothetical protein
MQSEGITHVKITVKCTHAIARGIQPKYVMHSIVKYKLKFSAVPKTSRATNGLTSTYKAACAQLFRLNQV